MAEQEQEMQKDAEVKPPKPAEFAGDVKSGSFRNLQYFAPESETQKPIEAARGPWWKRFSSARYPPPAKTEDVVEALSRQSSQKLTPRGNSDLPPPSPGRVGLPTVTLVETQEPPKDKATQENTPEEGGDGSKPESIARKSPVITGMSISKTETETEGIESAVAPEVPKQNVGGEAEAIATLPPESETKIETEPVTTEEVKNETEGVNKVEGSSIDANKTEKDETVKVEEPTEKKSEAPALAKARIEGVGGSMKETSTTDRPTKLRSNTMSKLVATQPTFFSRLFSFGITKPASDVKEVTKKEETSADVVKETQKTTSAEEPKDAESASAKEVAGMKAPPDPEHSTEPESGVVAEQVVPKASVKHEYISSDLTQAELEELKALFISEMKLKGIDVEGKYTKSSSDFGTPLLFLLDLHTFAEMEHSTVKMEQLLAQKYGAEHSLVSEFNEAAARKTVATEGKAEAEETTTGICENLDTARNGSGATPKEPKPAESSSDAQAETTEAAKEVTTAPHEKPTAPGQTEQEPPSIPPLRDETKSLEQKGCAFCICLFPKAE